MQTLERPITVGIDGTTTSQPAIAWAADAAQRHAVPLRLVYVIDSPGPRVGYDYISHELDDAGAEAAARARDQALAGHPGLTVQTATVNDDSTHALINESDHASMIVVGSRGHSGFYDMVVGSTSLHTAMHAHCPVAVIRPRTVDADNPAHGRVVVGVGDSPHAAQALGAAFEEAALRGVGLTAVHVRHGRDDRSDLDAMLAPWSSRHPAVDVVEVTPSGDAAKTLIQLSQGAELFVCGCRGHGGITGLLRGSTSQAMLHHAGCPVLVVHDHDQVA
ncbi:universal stress protein [Catellatospora sp. TT07R-123]|uniref:universal stress protein n=1 Tax=Catellatospora sp. TT07R-123 TaxID=2733863 RepID=UPI001B2A9F87|nr:universal stress protein [Catellatospora sp. TT07R-123]GHJ48175.1 universal stress protein [Catellatospora sp. TT07R-123]